MPVITYVRYTTQQVNTSERENRRSEEGITYAEVLSDELGVNPSKFNLLVNGVVQDDLDAEVQNGDSLVLQPKKYSSGSYLV